MHRAVRGLLSAALLFFVLPFALAAERVVSLAPSLTEMMLDLNAGELLVGAVDGAPRAAALVRLPSVGRYDQLDFETLVTLQPDLVLAWSDSLSAAQRQQLKTLGIAVFAIAPRSLAGLGEAYAALGERIGRYEEGLDLAQRFAGRIAQIRQQYARSIPLRVFYQVWESPLYTLGGTQIVSDALQVCGAHNVFANLTLPAPQVSVEAVIEENPQVILLSSSTQAKAWQRWPMISAVQSGQVWVIPDEGLERPSLQMLEALDALCRLLAKAQ